MTALQTQTNYIFKCKLTLTLEHHMKTVNHSHLTAVIFALT